MTANQKMSPREWKQTTVSIDIYRDLSGPIEEVCRFLREKAKGIKDADLEMNIGDYEAEAYITGWVRRTKEEIDEYDKKKQKAAQNARKKTMTVKQKLQEKEMKELERLSKKYPDMINKV